ncbi:MAG: flagellar type III secretion system pore protein FliP [Melioribacteraceae bacterium]|nr:flagellar type III secretion system pore protein FliP [Melioribacteraceae bacterium]MCF8355141.1 flagellar type III secretion system pore protein FliP [Melioribacteraceae bacterium]MCF8392470.1 flagellar type III secretion system pore protein FliP [Melioribacteraceae bacterium]MCF8418381.1 flagellar type III secretion system pore protein FliP [Melioribacteraceae bacterium]
MKKNLLITIFVFMLLFAHDNSFAQAGQGGASFPQIGVNISGSDDPEDVSVTLQLLLLLTVLSLAPSIIIMTTSYLRIIIVLQFLKNALGTMQMPPNQLLAGIALFVTFFVMAPTFTQINDNALQPYMENKIDIDSAYAKGIKPLREFMMANVKDEDLELFIGFADINKPNTRDELPTHILIPSFVLSELKTGFIMGFFIFIPFLMVDMIVASILMSMGMMMIPPMMVALPFKLLLFILVDGWNLVVGSLVRSFTG